MQMQEALKQLLQLYIEHQKAKQAEQAELRKQFAKQLKENGFDPSADNVKAFEAHVKEVRGAEKDLAKVEADIAKLEKSAGLKPEKAAKLEDLKLKRSELAERLEDLQEGVGLESQLKPDPNAQILRKVQGKKKEEAAAPEGVEEAAAGPAVDAAVEVPAGPEVDAAVEAPKPGWNQVKAAAKGPAEKAQAQAPKLGGYRGAPGEKGVQGPDAADQQNEVKLDGGEPDIEPEALQNDALPGQIAAEPEAPAIQPKRGRAATMPAAPKAGQAQEGATRMFRSNSVGAKLMETKSLSPQAQWVAGIVNKQAEALGQNQNVSLGRKR